MIESAWAQAAIQLILLALVSLLVPASYRVIVGPTLPDRLGAVDLITTLLIGIIVMLALVESTQTFVDMAIALAAFAFIGTISIARYISEGRVF
ncbi:MAG: monovalent cation/H+ antiporter complex subunit F [Chloroflexi bacterium]|nr:monovalent cation/H+ antiporter complex subunit F [Chloroflexota bacterium]